ncbi:uncharacterized protein LOC116196189 isoform X2 [Punica granatum]|uniref:Uncharacterized protein LOC116196189 isoform X2 n=2 Tax=Punica granatum TaxID=22663 RepID=A0A6P8CGU8_PUNGR|nr:uncharacterized protein LOC116196189 isoform X2 [Punica granatum]
MQSVMSYAKILNNFACSKPGLAIFLWPLKCTFKAALEQEIENLNKKLAASTRENLDLQEELSEAYRIKSQLADLHSAEATKNLEAEKQLKFFQGCVAAAFAERDHSIMEAEKAKEKEELMFQKLNEVEKKMERLNSDCLEQKRLIDKLQADLAKQQDENEAFKKVVDMFYGIRWESFQDYQATSWDQKCTCLLEDPPEVWSYNDPSTSKYISALEEELHSVRNSMDNLQNKLRVGLEIENHLKKRVRELEKNKIASDKIIRNSLAGLRHHHSLQRVQIMNILEEEKSHIKSMISVIEEKIRQVNGCREMDVECSPSIVKLDENYCTDRGTIDVGIAMAPEKIDTYLAESKGDPSEALAQALQEKVAALLLLSQQEERHLLEKNVNAALQKKVEELQRNLLQVTTEKVRALMELAQLKQDYHLLKEKSGPGMKIRRDLTASGDNRHATHEQEGKLRNILKKTYLSRWINKGDFGRNSSDACLSDEGNTRQSNQSMEFARMKIENATLKESLESMEHLTSTIHRLRASLSQVKESAMLGGRVTGVFQVLEEITSEAMLVRTALSSCLPVSWSAGADTESPGGGVDDESSEVHSDSSNEKLDSVSAAGFEMVELLILAAEVLKEYTVNSKSEHCKTERTVPFAPESYEDIPS